MSRQSKRTIKKAIEYLDREIKLSRRQRENAIEKIKNAKQQMVEAKRIVQQIRKAKFAIEIDGDFVDHSDVQELRVKLIRRDFGLWSPQREFLKRLDKHIAINGMTGDEFLKEAGVLLAIPQALSKKVRMAETRCW
jgi:hypothetical protein